MYQIRNLLLSGLLLFGFTYVGEVESGTTQQIPADRLLTDEELVLLLDVEDYPLANELRQQFSKDPEATMKRLAADFRDLFAERFYFDWRNVDARFTEYRDRFPHRETGHRSQADIHLGLYPASARWKLPYRNLKGNEVSAYELRHLARQHKVLDMAFVHHYENGAPGYVDYFTGQMRSLNEAFRIREFEDDEGGNGVYESFRAGYRAMNWLQVHAFFLGSEAYRWQDQVELVRTMLHTGAVLHEKNQKFRYGNHQTRGASALAMIAILFRDFTGTEAWYRDAMDILGQHLEKEVNDDGFQFERSVHYHIGDIYNFFRVMQLAQLNGFAVPAEWERKLRGMFDAAITLARPDRRLPVLQDDTDQPWAESNEMGDFMQLGSILFDDPEINYFASKSVAPGVYWWLRSEQIAFIGQEERTAPVRLSGQLPDTGYYVMREGWGEIDAHMVISAGLSEHKPDHQHGDMLGLVAYANGRNILPNYQVRYSLPDFEYFKNSFVKNVAIVDGIPHGLGWKSNRGGSGFGKWEHLPQPQTLAWARNEAWDFYAGTHDGYAGQGVTYFRKVLFFKGLGWIVRDIFESSSGEHAYQQIWQGHYSDEGDGNHHRSTFADGSGLEILQLGGRADSCSTTLRRGKGNLICTQVAESGEYTTLLFPFGSFNARIPQSFFDEKHLKVKDWTLRVRTDRDLETSQFVSDAALVMEHDGGVFLLGTKRLTRGEDFLEFRQPGDLHVSFKPGKPPSLTWLGHDTVLFKLSGSREGRLQPGAQHELKF